MDGKQNWKIGEDAELEPHSIDLNELSARAFRRDILKDASRISPSEDNRFGKPEAHRWHWRSPLVMVLAGLPGLAIFIASFWTRDLLAYQCWSLADAAGNDWSGLLRLVLILIGLGLLGVAFPVYRVADWTQEGEDQLERDHNYFARKQFQRKD